MDRPVRLLLPWLDRDEAIAFQLGQLPLPGQDISAQLKLWEDQKAALALRSSYALPTPSIGPLPDGLAERAEKFKQRPDIRSAFGNLDWQVGMVSLEGVLSFQKSVALEQVEERVEEATHGDLDRLFSICLPDQRSEQFGGLIDQAGKAMTFSSLNPNLRVVGNIVQEIQLSNDPTQAPQPVKFAGFAVSLASSFIQIAEYRGRWFVRDGYHRCYGLLKQGVTRIPCVFIRA